MRVCGSTSWPGVAWFHVGWERRNRLTRLRHPELRWGRRVGGKRAERPDRREGRGALGVRAHPTEIARVIVGDRRRGSLRAGRRWPTRACSGRVPRFARALAAEAWYVGQA